MSKETKDTYFQRIQKAVDFIEKNLKEDIDLDQISKAAFFSKYHFLRVFKAMTGETTGQYLRKRRISISARELIRSDLPIIQIAFDYKFESQEAYTRSFKQVFGMTPGKYRKEGVDQIAFAKPRLSERRLIHLKSQEQMKPEIKEITSKTLLGLSTSTSLADNQIPKLWVDFMKYLPAIRHNAHNGYFEVHPFDPDFEMKAYVEETTFEKWAAVEVKETGDVPDGLALLELHGGKYAVFEHRGSMSNVQLSFDFIYGTWLPNSGHLLDERNDFEFYGEDYPGPESPEAVMEIWIPIK